MNRIYLSKYPREQWKLAEVVLERLILLHSNVFEARLVKHSGFAIYHAYLECLMASDDVVQRHFTRNN